MSRNKIIKLTAAAVVLLISVIMLILNFTVFAPPKYTGEKNVQLKIEYSDIVYDYKELKTNGEYFIDLLNDYNDELDLKMKAEDSAYGKFITSLKGVDASEGAYYTFTVNGEYAMYGASSQPVKDGDVFVISYGVSEYDDSFNLVNYTLKPSAGMPAPKGRGVFITVAVVCGIGILAGVGMLIFMFVYDRKKKNADN